MRRSFGCIIPTVRFFFLLGLVLCFCLLRRIFSWERPIKEGFFFLSLDAFSDDVDGVACPPFFFLLLFYNNERNRTFFFFLSSYIFILCVQWVCIPPFPLAVDSLKLISSSVLSNVHTWWIGASHRRHCQSVDTLRSCVCVVLASLEGPLKGALPKRTLVMLLLHFFFIFKKGNLFFFCLLGCEGLSCRTWWFAVHRSKGRRANNGCRYFMWRETTKNGAGEIPKVEATSCVRIVAAICDVVVWFEAV